MAFDPATVKTKTEDLVAALDAALAAYAALQAVAAPTDGGVAYGLVGGQEDRMQPTKDLKASLQVSIAQLQLLIDG